MTAPGRPNHRPWYTALNTTRLMIAILFVLLFAMAVRVPTDTDTWWHLRAGETMFQTREILQKDLFSLTRYDQPWINHSWGAQLIMTAFFKVFGGAEGNGGNWGLAIYTALLATGGMAFVYLSSEGNVFVKAFVIILASAAAAVFWTARPQMTSFLLSAALLYLLYLYKRHKIDWLWAIPVMMLFWVNLHGGFSIGFILLGGFIAGEILGRLFDGRPQVLSWRAIGKLILITAISGVVLVVNPNTTQMWGYPFKTFGIGVLQQFIQEWASPDFHGRETWPFIFLLIGTLAAVGLSAKRIDWTDLALVSGTAFMALYAGRNISTFALVAAPVMIRHLSAYLGDIGFQTAKPRQARGFALALNWLILILILFGAGLKVVVTLAPKTVAQAQAEILPVRVAEYLNKHKPAGPMFNSYNWGGYLMFAAPDYRVFVDGRTDLYDDELLRQWLNTLNGQDWQATFSKWQIQLAVIEKNSVLADILRRESGWKEAYQDDQASVFQVKAP